MAISTFLKIVTLGIALASSSFAQQQTNEALEGKNQETEKQIELAKQRYARLRRADFAKLEVVRPPLEFNQKPDELLKPYKSGSGIHFVVSITNISNDSVGVPFGDTYRQIRPVLLRGGDLVPYRKDIDEVIKKVGDDPNFRSTGTMIDPKRTANTSVALNDWYERLLPGSYELTVKMRFIWGGAWIESSRITFEVAAQDK
jgi:hypothetical protein